MGKPMVKLSIGFLRQTSNLKPPIGQKGGFFPSMPGIPCRQADFHDWENPILRMPFKGFYLCE